MVNILEVKIQEEVLSLLQLHVPIMMFGTQVLLLSLTPFPLPNSKC